MTDAAGQPAEQDTDRCPFSRAFSRAFSEHPACPAYQGTTFAVTDTAGRFLRSATTCRHLTVGQDGERRGRFYPRCALGAAANRVAWVATVTPGRLAVMRSLEEEFAELTAVDRARLLAAKERLLAADALDAAHVEDLEIMLSRFLDVVDGLIIERAQRLSDVGLAPDRLTELAHDWSLAWLRSRQIFRPTVAEMPLDGFGTASSAFLGATYRDVAAAPGAPIAVAGRLHIDRSVAPAAIRLQGDIDVANSDVLATALAAMLAEGGDVTIDFSEVLFCDVSGLRAVVRGVDGGDRQQRVILVGLPAHLRRALGIVGWAQLPNLVIADDPVDSTSEITRSSG